MTCLSRLLLVLSLLAFWAVSTPTAFAQTSGSSTSTSSSSSHADESGDRIGLTNLSEAHTSTITTGIGDIDRTCADMLPAPPRLIADESLYLIDCYRLKYQEMAASLPEGGDYAPVKRALEVAAGKLDRIVRNNLDPNAPQLTVAERARPSAPRNGPLRAIRPETKDRALREAQAVVQELQTVILRSGEIPTRRTAHYTRIAAAVQSNLVVLRSA